jgi:hypothetical protein
VSALRLLSTFRHMTATSRTVVVNMRRRSMPLDGMAIVSRARRSPVRNP